jgi:hypothetical protein
MIEDMQLRGLSPHTQAAYLMRVTLFARFCNKHPDHLGEKEVREYLLHLVNEKHASYAVVTQTYFALRFLYNAERMVMRSPLLASPANASLCRLFTPHKIARLQ